MLVAILNQITYPPQPQHGDADDCWCVATIWGRRVSFPPLALPTIDAFRAKAGDPDDGYRDGGNIDEVMKGAKGLWPDSGVIRYQGTWDGFVKKLRAGWIASVAVWSADLPSGLRFGFLYAHQVGAYVENGTIYVANPLAKHGAAPLPVSEAALRAACTAPELHYPNNEVRAAFFPHPKEDDVPAIITTALPGYSAVVAGPSDTNRANVRTMPALGAPTVRSVPKAGETWPAVVGWVRGDKDPDNGNAQTNTLWLEAIDADGSRVYTAHSNVKTLTKPADASPYTREDVAQARATGVADAIARITLDINATQSEIKRLRALGGYEDSELKGNPELGKLYASIGVLEQAREGLRALA